MIRFTFFVLCFLAKFIKNEENAPEDIARSARLIDPDIYFVEVAQEMIYELEERGWSSLKAIDITQNINELTHTNLLVAGQVHYTNGFLVSIQKIQINNMRGSLGHSVIDNVTITTATVRGSVVFRDTKIGYDVAVNLSNEDHIRHYTGYFPHSTIEMEFFISKNLNTNETSVSSTLLSLSGGSGVRMQFMPVDEISQVISLTFMASSNWNGVRSWITDTMAHIMLDIVRNKIQFPELCFTC